jgi:hypothetical protein
MQTEGHTSSVTYQIKTKFSVSAFYREVYFTFWHINFSHHYFKMIDQSLHIVINFFFRRQIKIRNISMDRS